jgi:hypothetical protein
MHHIEFLKLTKGLDKNSKQYLDIWSQYQQSEEKKKEDRIYRARLIKRFKLIAHPVRQKLQVSTLNELSNKDLINVGKALKSLYDEMGRAGLFNGF